MRMKIIASTSTAPRGFRRTVPTLDMFLLLRETTQGSASCEIRTAHTKHKNEEICLQECHRYPLYLADPDRVQYGRYGVYGSAPPVDACRGIGVQNPGYLRWLGPMFRRFLEGACRGCPTGRWRYPDARPLSQSRLREGRADARLIRLGARGLAAGAFSLSLWRFLGADAHCGLPPVRVRKALFLAWFRLARAQGNTWMTRSVRWVFHKPFLSKWL